MAIGKCHGLPSAQVPGKGAEHITGRPGTPLAVSFGENNQWAMRCWLDSVTAESWDGDPVSGFGGVCLNCGRLLNCVLASIPNVSELK